MPAATPTPTTATTTVPRVPPSLTAHAAPAPTTAAAGRVTIQAIAICPATPHWTDARRRPAPAPKIDPVATWVVDRANPMWDEVRMTAALLTSAAKPCGLWMSLTRLPRVWMIRQPPKYVPRPMARPQARMTQRGGPAEEGSAPAVISVRVMTPMVFCASLVPWASDTSDADTIWPIRNPPLVVLSSTRAVTRYAR